VDTDVRRDGGVSVGFERAARRGVGVRAEIVAVGTELLLGQITNTNARWMSEQLAAIGVDVLHQQVVGDNLERVVDSLRWATSRADVVIVCGGLGPTEDDLTRDAVAKLLDARLVRHPELEEMLREKFRGFSHDAMPANNLRQADVPAGVRPILPVLGTAPGLAAVTSDGTPLYAVPGVPAEMVEMMEGAILPELAALTGGTSIVSTVLRITGKGESAVAETLADLFVRSSNPTIAYLADMGEVRVRLTAKARTDDEAKALLAPLADEVRARLGDVVFSEADETLERTVVRLLAAAGRTLACAESLTGGGVGARITSVPGASSVFVGSAVVYTADAKHDVLGVPRAVLQGPGPVREACALGMAAGARRLFGADVALALTGAAGPEPHGSASPGTIWIALDAGDLTHARGFRAAGERERVRRWAEQAGLDLVRRYLTGEALPTSETTV
jgi:nicotinamide-nucleotide amidase